jgi:nicotinic acid phosphoribosyltransferase
MRFFTLKWLRGELTDAEFEVVSEAYLRHLSSLQLPADVRSLSEISLHDGRVLNVSHEPQVSRLALRVRCGDLQRGYSDVHLVYSDSVIDAASVARLQHAATPPADEVLYDEVDRVDDRFEHRLILASHQEVRVSFEAVRVMLQPVEGREAN